MGGEGRGPSSVAVACGEIRYEKTKVKLKNLVQLYDPEKDLNAEYHCHMAQETDVKRMLSEMN